MYNRCANTSSHRYSFQGQEHDDEIKGDGNTVIENLEETGVEYDNPYVPKKSDSARVYIWRDPTENRGGRVEIKTIAKKDTVDQKVNSKNYGNEYENAPIMDIK